MTDVFAYAELDEILRGAGLTGAIGMSAIDGLIAALVAAPSLVHPEEMDTADLRRPSAAAREQPRTARRQNDLQSLQRGLGNAR